MSLPFNELLYLYLLGLWIYQLLVPQERFYLIIRKAVWVGIGLLIALLGYSGYLLYLTRSLDPLGRFLLPPHITWWDFLSYWFIQFSVEYAVAFAIAGLGFWKMHWLNKRFQERFFYPSEFWLLLLSVLYAGHPGWLVFGIFMLIALLVLVILKNQRVSFYYLWLPASALTLITIQILISKIPWVKDLVFHT